MQRVDTSQSDETVPENEFGALLWLILDAAGETDIGPSPFMDQATGTRLDDNALLAALTGNTLHISSGGSVSAAFTADRTIYLMVEGTVVLTGYWYVVHDMLYAEVPGTDISGHYIAFQDGKFVSLYRSDGLLSVQFEINKGLPDGL